MVLTVGLTEIDVPVPPVLHAYDIVPLLPVALTLSDDSLPLQIVAGDALAVTVPTDGVCTVTVYVPLVLAHSVWHNSSFTSRW